MNLTKIRKIIQKRNTFLKHFGVIPKADDV
jgi:hypothetical protein